MKSDVEFKKGSPDRFGHSWNIYNEILPIHEEQFLRWTEGVDKAEWQGKSFLDVGCGIGRNSYWPMKYGAKSATCIDVDSRTLSAAEQNLSDFENVNVLFKSIYELDVVDTFDISFSIGVIHHLADPEKAVRNMARATRPGGKVLVWLYGYENNEWIVKYFNPFRKAVFSKIPLPITHFFSIPLTSILWSVLKAGFGKTRYFDLLRKLTFRHLRAIVYDHMLPETAGYYTKQQAIELLEQAGLKEIETYHVNDISWAVIGRKVERV